MRDGDSIRYPDVRRGVRYRRSQSVFLIIKSKVYSYYLKSTDIPIASKVIHRLHFFIEHPGSSLNKIVRCGKPSLLVEYIGLSLNKEWDGENLLFLLRRRWPAQSRYVFAAGGFFSTQKVSVDEKADYLSDSNHWTSSYSLGSQKPVQVYPAPKLYG